MFPVAAADRIQETWLLPYEFTDLTPELPAATPAVVTDDGAVYQPDSAPGMAEAEVDGARGEGEPHRDYAVALARSGGLEVLAADPALVAAARRELAEQGREAGAWLLRGEAEPGGGHRVRLLRGPEPVLPRPRPELPLALLCDLGMVLTRFDRGLFDLHYRALFGRAVPPAGRAAMDARRPAFERGELAVEEFWERVRGPLGLAAPDFGLFAHAWGAILSPRRSTLALVRALAALPRVAVVVVSNTDPLMLRHCREVLGLGDLLERVAASCQPGVQPKGRDASLWRRGRELAAEALGAPPRMVVAVDDVRAYLALAREAGAVDRTIHYRHYAQFRYELGRLGLYLPLARRSAPTSR